MAPTRLRKKASEEGPAVAESPTSRLLLGYRPPYDWHGMLAFLAARALDGVEHVTGDSYARTVQLGEAKGWLRVTRSKKSHALILEFTHGLTAVLPALLNRIRGLFDLDARPDQIARHLRKDARLASAVKANPGIRVPGAFNGFEMGLRAIIGQQVTVRAATTIACRFVEAFGDPIITPIPHRAMICACLLGFVVSSIGAWLRGAMNAPATPCRARKITISSRFCAIPHSIEAITKPATDQMNSRREPIRSDSQPVIGIATAEAMM